jgi:hypothetical protein
VQRRYPPLLRRQRALTVRCTLSAVIAEGQIFSAAHIERRSEILTKPRGKMWPFAAAADTKGFGVGAAASTLSAIR